MSATQGAKAPQDHQAKAVKPKVEKVTVFLEGSDGEVREVPGRRVTVRGIAVDVPDEALDDFEVLDDIRAVQDQKDASRLPALLRRLVGEQYQSILDQLRGPNGRVSAAEGTQFVLELFQGLNPNS